MYFILRLLLLFVLAAVSTTLAYLTLFSLRLFAAAVAVKSLLGDRELVDLWCNISQDLLCLLVECELSSNQVSQVAKRLGLITDKINIKVVNRWV